MQYILVDLPHIQKGVLDNFKCVDGSKDEKCILREGCREKTAESCEIRASFPTGEFATA